MKTFKLFFLVLFVASLFCPAVQAEGRRSQRDRDNEWMVREFRKRGFEAYIVDLDELRNRRRGSEREEQRYNRRGRDWNGRAMDRY